MVHNITEASCETDFVLTVRCSIYQYPVELCISMDDTVSDLKGFMGKTMELFHDEMTFMISLSCPYPLPDDMKLCRLLDEHRHLILRIHEGKEECYGKSSHTDTSMAWYSGQPMPDRYLVPNGNDTFVFDFRYLAASQIPRIRSWIYSHRNISEIWLLGTNPCVSQIMYALAEDIASFTILDRIIIQHPLEKSYTLPIHSQGRHADFHKDGIVSHIYRDAIVYLYQHLILDQYRESVDNISIIIHGGLLDSQPNTFQFEY